jgi:hypothetical protein
MVRRVTALFKLAVEPRNRSSRENSTHCHHLPRIRNFHSDSYAEIGTDSLRTRPFPPENSCARDTPPSGHRTPGVSCGSVPVATFNGQTGDTALSSSPSTVKPFQQRTAGKCHHPPGIKNSKSESYAGMSTDRLRTTLRAWCTSLHELHGTVTICPELRIPNQKVTQG